jgi:hypothetical protein
MPNVRFDIQVLSETYYKIGKDEIQFYLRQIKELIFIEKWLLVGRCLELCSL